jgi:hypothetical protein
MAIPEITENSTSITHGRGASGWDCMVVSPQEAPVFNGRADRNQRRLLSPGEAQSFR